MAKNKRSSGIEERIKYLKKHEAGININDVIVKELVHELQTYKIELEVQNEELRSAQAELEESHSKYLFLFETAPVGFFMLDHNGMILEVNEKGSALLGQASKHALSHRFQEFIDPEHLITFYTFFKNVSRGSRKEVSEVRLHKTSRYVQMEGVISGKSSKNNKFTMQLAIVDVTQRKKDEAREAKNTLAQQKQILNTILDTQEEERIRIAESLHNGLGQLLYATRLKLEDIKGNGKVKSEVTGFLDEAIKESRDLSFILMPSLLKDFGLKITLEEIAKRFSTKNFKVECHVTGLKNRLPANLEIAVFRIIQELLNNVIKHAKATKAAVLVKKEKAGLKITFRDNGCGFDHEQTLKIRRGSGLSSVYNRLELLNGSLRISSKPGKGTTINVTI
ncbi:MAG TPA: PAS domain-containing sensor histidine kinase [Bacteroidia bacterium]|jgi:PAS domain S-box-containing protein